MSINSLRKGLGSFDLDDDDSELSLEEIGPKSIAILRGDPELSLEEVGPKSMAILAGSSTVGPTSQEVNGKEGVPVPQPRPRKKPQEDKQVADLAQQLDREKRESEARAKQQDELIADLKAQLESKERQLDAATKTSHSKSSLRQELARKDAELKSLKDKTKAEIERKVAEKVAKRKSETASLQKEISDLKGQLEIKNDQLEEWRRLVSTRDAEKKQLRKEAEKIRGQLIKQTKTDDTKAKQAEIDGLTAEVDDLKNQLQIKGAQVNDLSQLASTRGEEKDQLAREVERLKEELLKLEQSRGDEGKTKQVEISRLTAEISDLKRQLRDKNAHIQDLSQSANHQGVEKEQLAKEAEELKGELLTLRQSRTDDGKTKQAEISRLTGEIRDLRGQLQAKSNQIEQLNRLVSTHVEKKNQLEREVEKLQGNLLSMHQARNDDSKAKHIEMERLNSEIGTLKGQLQIKKAQVEDLSQLASTRGEEKELLENNVKQLQEQLLKMQHVRTSLTDDNQAKLAKIKELTMHLNSLSRQMEQQGRETEQLKRDLAVALRAGGGRPDLTASTPAVNGRSTSSTAPVVNDDRTCPMCRKRFPEPISQQEYERHVQSHF